MVDRPSLAAFAAAARSTSGRWYGGTSARPIGLWSRAVTPSWSHRAGGPVPEDLPSIEAVEHAWLARLGVDDEDDR